MSRNIVFLSASPRAENDTASGTYLSMVEDRIRTDKATKITINVRQSLIKGQAEQDFKRIANADALVIAFPLYFFCMPGMLTRFLEDYYHFYLESGKSQRRQKVYAIVNCGFPEPEINEEAVRVVKSFCNHIGAAFRFGILIGGGGLVIGAKNAPFMKKTISSLDHAMDELAKDAMNDIYDSSENFVIKPNFPRRLYYFGGNTEFKGIARKNGMKKQTLYRKPYRPHEG